MKKIMKHLNLLKILEKFPLLLGMICVILAGRGWGKSERVKEICLDDFSKGKGRFEWVVNTETMLNEEKDNWLDGMKMLYDRNEWNYDFNPHDFIIDGRKIYHTKQINSGKKDKEGNIIYENINKLAGKFKLLVELKTKGSRTKIANFVYDEFNDGIPNLHKNHQFKWWWKRLITLTQGENPPRIWLMGNNENHNTELGIKLGLSKIENGISYDDTMLVIKDERNMEDLFGGKDAKVVKLAKRFNMYDRTFSTEYMGIERYNIVDLKNLSKFKFIIGFSTSKDDISHIVSIYNGNIGNENIYYAVSEEYREVFSDKNRGNEWISKNIIAIAKNNGNEDFKVINQKVKETFKNEMRNISNKGQMYFRYERCRELFNEEIFK